MYFFLGISLMLALLLAVNLLISAIATILWQAIAPIIKSQTARRQAQVIFALRIFPLAATLAFVAALMLPAYFLFEPPTSKEIVTFKLAFLAGVSMLGVGVAAFRVFGTWWKTRRLLADWLISAEPTAVSDVKIPVYRIRHPFPLIAVVGTFRPRMFIAEQIFSSLNAEEFRAAICHEYGHIVAHDNLKRTLMRFCRDLLVFPFGRNLDRAWTDKIEAAADEFAAQTGGKSAALNLASALLKIARIAPTDAKPAMPAGAFLIGTQNADVAWRVRSLLRLAEMKRLRAEHGQFKIKSALPLYFIGFLASALFFLNENVLYKTHLALEWLVSLLQ